MDFSEWITRQYLQWQEEQGRRRSVKDFAAYLGVPQQALSCWMSGAYRPKGMRNVTHLAEKLGPEVYERLDLPNPQPQLEEQVIELARALQEFPPEARTLVREAATAAIHQALQSGQSSPPEQVVRLLVEELNRRL